MAEQQKVSFKDTLNLPRTDFPIHPKYGEEDITLLERWKEQDLYRASFEHNKGGQKFIIHDGPPYTNGHTHLGHAYNKILKDIAGKSARMAGKQVPITPGFDCHGLPIELKVTQEHQAANRIELKKACRAYSERWIEVQTKEFKRLGVLMDFARPYKTMDPGYEASIIRAFGEFVQQGFIERKHKPVPWCFSCQTVLAAAEIEYQDRKDPSIYVAFPLTDAALTKVFPNLAGKQVSLLVWTTTPWTLPLNRAVVLAPNTSYVVLDVKGKLVVVGKPLAEKVCGMMGVPVHIVAETAVDYFEGTKVQHPFLDQESPVFIDQMVSLEDGTACVHSAPGCGPEDYILGLKHNLEIFSPLSPDGRYTPGVKPDALIGMPITDALGWVIKRLSELDRLVHKTSLTHAYPHCWRCHNGLMYRSTMQWFCSLEQKGLRERALQAIDTVNFIPRRSSNFLRATVSSRLEWCLSRQRVWGVPIPALLCKNGDSAFIDPILIEKVAAGVAREGIEYWDRVTAEELTPERLKCAQCDSTEFVKEQDILDVWFESGISNYAVLKQNPELGFPADLYIEGLDQHRAWFQSSLFCSLVVNNAPPYRAVITHGFTVDEQGRKMSKSLGNVVTSEQVIEQLGTDGLRLWAASISFEGDAVMSQTLLTNIKEVNRKIRNTCRFLLANLYDFDAKDMVPESKLQPVDYYALMQLHQCNAKIRAAYEQHDVTAVFHELGSYCASELSAFYLDIIKDRLYVEQPDGHLRRSAQTACWYILDTMTKLMAPVLSFTAELVSDHYQKGKKTSIHLQAFAQLPSLPSLLAEQWEKVREMRGAVLKAIEVEREKGIIKQSLEAQVRIYIDPQQISLSPQFDEAFMKEWFIVSQVDLRTSSAGLAATAVPGVWVEVVHAEGDKCPRCWNWTVTKHEHKLCNRCESIVKK